MSRSVVGLTVGILAWLGATLDLEAQVEIDPIGPTCVAEDASTSLYECMVTCDADFTFSLKVYLQGELMHTSWTFVVNSGPTYAFSETIDHTGWGMYSGDKLNYFGLAKEYGTKNYDKAPWIVIVSIEAGCRANEPVPGEGPVELRAAVPGRRFNA